MTVLGAGILCYMYSPKPKGIYFLLGKERGKTGSWSALGGRADPTDRDAMYTAAREFVEESCGVVYFTPEDKADKYMTVEKVYNYLKNKHYAFEIRIKLGDTNRYKICYIVEIFWQPEIPVNFGIVRSGLRSYHRTHDSNHRHALLDQLTHLKGHPGLQNEDCLEKSELKLVAYKQLRSIIQNKGKHMGKTLQFRKGFVPILFIVIEKFSEVLHNYYIMECCHNDAHEERR